MFIRSIWILAFFVVISGCVPTQEDTPVPRIYDSLEYKANVSRLLGDGGKNTEDQYGTIASDIIWKDSAGTERSLKALSGKVVVLNMWAAWCEPCREEMPDLQQLANDYKDNDVYVIGISIDRAREPFRSVLEFARDYSVNYQLILDSAATAYINYGGTGDIPKTYIIGRDGYIQYTFTGKATKSTLDEAIQSVL